jgi:hypothetical protein
MTSTRRAGPSRLTLFARIEKLVDQVLLTLAWFNSDEKTKKAKCKLLVKIAHIAERCVKAVMVERFPLRCVDPYPITNMERSTFPSQGS